MSQGMAPLCGNLGFATLVAPSPIANQLNVRTIVHEIGHLLGAGHTSFDGSVMDPFPSGNVIHFAVSSVDEINSCMGIDEEAQAY